MKKSPPLSERLDQIIHILELQPHPEGGFFRENYRSNGMIQSESLDSSYSGERNYATSIYFLLTTETFSAFHRIKQDEIWHFYDGSPIDLHIISEEGNYTKTRIGRDIIHGETPQFVVPGGSWFGATVVRKDDFTLLGCTVSPGFDFRDFELGMRDNLIGKFPQHTELITQLTRK